MEVIIIFFIIFIAFAFFIIISKLSNDYRQRRLIESYSEMIDKLRSDMTYLERDNIYSLEEYRIKKLRKSADEELGSIEHKLVWSEEIGEYIKTPVDENDY